MPNMILRIYTDRFNMCLYIFYSYWKFSITLNIIILYYNKNICSYSYKPINIGILVAGVAAT